MLHQRQEAQALPQNRSCGISLLLIPFLVLKPMSTGVTAEQNPQHVKAFNAFPVMLFMTCQQQGEVEYYIPRACTVSNQIRHEPLLSAFLLLVHHTSLQLACISTYIGCLLTLLHEALQTAFSRCCCYCSLLSVQTGSQNFNQVCQ